MGFFEAVMMICFGASWPISICKTIKVKNPAGKSVFFLWLIIIGYVAGCIHKIWFHYDWVLYLYVLNLIMVSTDLFFVIRYNRMIRKGILPGSSKPTNKE